MNVQYLSLAEAARRLGVARKTLGNTCRRIEVGIVVESGRVVAVRVSDLARIKAAILPVGNPSISDYAAAGGKARWKKR